MGRRISNTQEYDPESFDRLDYMIYCMKQEGIYIYLDMMVSRVFHSGDGLEITEKMTSSSRPYSVLDRRMIELEKKYMSDLWNHVNPYTGIAYKDDPAITVIENPHYLEGNNITSLYEARDYLPGAFVLEGDLVIANKQILRSEERMRIEGKDYQIFDLNVPSQAHLLYQKAGNLLEMYCSLGAVKAGCFHDCQVGVMLDWDREDGNSADDVRNEVDVVLTCGHIPIFISCKNTQIENEYLYEIKTMARRFGGRYAVPAIVSTARHKQPIRDRAKEMGIVLLDEVHRLTLAQFSDRLGQAFCPRR
jgi:hypothetical protein